METGGKVILKDFMVIFVITEIFVIVNAMISIVGNDMVEITNIYYFIFDKEIMKAQFMITLAFTLITGVWRIVLKKNK